MLRKPGNRSGAPWACAPPGRAVAVLRWSSSRADAPAGHSTRRASGVGPTPYAREARENYADSWRTKRW